MKILICGDYIVYDKLRINSKSIFGDFLKVIQNADIAIYNQEFPVSRSNKIYSTKKHGLTPTSSPESLNPIKEAGFTHASLANNHILNRGIDGVEDTLTNLNNVGIDGFGAGSTLKDASKTLYVEQNNYRIAFLNFAENEYNTATLKHGGANPIDIVDNLKQIKEAKANADFVFVIIHGGIDYCRFPSPRAVKQYRFYAENGASAIVGHHSHVVSGYEEHKGVPIYYGIGNFIPGKIVVNDCLYSFPVLFEISENKKIKHTGYPLKFNTNHFHLEQLKDEDLKVFYQKVKEVNDSLNDPTNLNDKILSVFLNKERQSYYFTLFTRSNYFLFKLFRKLKLIDIYHWYIKRKMQLNRKNAASWNLHRCETHRDVLDLIYEKYIDTYTNK